MFIDSNAFAAEELTQPASSCRKVSYQHQNVEKLNHTMLQTLQ
jgi:hypothetical protein